MPASALKEGGANGSQPEQNKGSSNQHTFAYLTFYLTMLFESTLVLCGEGGIENSDEKMKVCSINADNNDSTVSSSNENKDSTLNITEDVCGEHHQETNETYHISPEQQHNLPTPEIAKSIAVMP